MPAGCIVADLTPDEGAPFEAIARSVGLAIVYLVAPTTAPERRARIASRTGGFLYCVSLVGVTGARSALPRSVGRLVREVRSVSPVPVAVGFGVSRPAHVRALVRAGADGVIVASALVDALGPMAATSRRSSAWSANCEPRLLETDRPPEARPPRRSSVLGRPVPLLEGARARR